MQDNRDEFEPFLEDDEKFDEYMGRMARDKEWGGYLELKAMSMKYNVNIIVHQFEAPVYAVCPFDPNEVRTLHLSYHMGEHYNSVRLIEDDGDQRREPPMPIP